MNELFDKARHILKLLEGYCLRIAKAMKVLGATLNYLQSETIEMQELTEQLMLQAMNEWEQVESVIKEAKKQIKKSDKEE